MSGFSFKTLVSFDGRIGRGAFWGLSIGTFVAIRIVSTVAVHIPTLGAILSLGVYFAGAVVVIPTQVKRLHDRGKSGRWWWLIGLLLLIPLVMIGVWLLNLLSAFSGGSGFSDKWMRLSGLIGLISLIGWLWPLIELGVLRGVSGPNRYGDPSSGSPFRKLVSVDELGG